MGSTSMDPIAEAALFLSPKTVRNNVSHVLTKLQVADPTQAIVRARGRAQALITTGRGLVPLSA